VCGVFSREACRVEMGRARERLWAAVFCMVWWAGYGVLLAINMAPDPDCVSVQYLPKGLNQKSHTNVGSDSAEEHVRLQLGAWDWNIHTYWHMTNGLDNCANCKQMKKSRTYMTRPLQSPKPAIAIASHEKRLIWYTQVGLGQRTRSGCGP
jgi:hypothetical protein